MTQEQIIEEVRAALREALDQWVAQKAKDEIDKHELTLGVAGGLFIESMYWLDSVLTEEQSEKHIDILNEAYNRCLEEASQSQP